MSMTTRHQGAAVLGIDPFSYEGLASPLQIDEAIRESGDVVWLEKYQTWFTGRYATVEAVLRDYETFESGAGTGMVNTRRDENWRVPSVILENNPPSHTKYRRIMTSILSQRVVRRLTQSFQQSANALVASVIPRGEINAAKELAEAFPLTVLPDAVGFQPEGREHLLPYSNLNFNAAGPRNELFRKAAEAAGEATEYVKWQMRREALMPDGLGHTIYAYVDEGEITEEDAGMLVRSFLSAGVDTTIFGIQAALRWLAERPDVWQRLRADPTLARAVFEETLRITPPSPFIGRTTTREVEIGGALIGAEEKVIVDLAAANRDPRRWERPDEFDLDRDTGGHLAFGTGIHGCVGQMMARMEATCLLTAIAEQAETIELIGEPQIYYSNWLRGYEDLPMRVTAKA